jgi:hypothetical protein
MNLKANEGTPKDLNEVAIRILCFRPPHDMRPDDWVTGIIKDYLAQKFGVLMLKAHTPEQEALLEELWKLLTGDKLGGSK